MKKILFLALAAAMLLAGCKNANNQKSNDMKTAEPLKEVAGRKNFGPNHALVTTPQPCVMIATWDKDHNPDVMMAAWAGQYDDKKIVISLSNLSFSNSYT